MFNYSSNQKQGQQYGLEDSFEKSNYIPGTQNLINDGSQFRQEQQFQQNTEQSDSIFPITPKTRLNTIHTNNFLNQSSIKYNNNITQTNILYKNSTFHNNSNNNKTDQYSNYNRSEYNYNSNNNRSVSYNKSDILYGSDIYNHNINRNDNCDKIMQNSHNRIENSNQFEESEPQNNNNQMNKNSVIITPNSMNVNYRKKRNALKNTETFRHKLFERQHEFVNIRRNRFFGLGRSVLVKNIASFFNEIKKKKMRIESIMKNFLNRLESTSSLRRAINLRDEDYEMINDISYYQKQDKEKQKSYQKGKCILFLTRNISVFMPSDQLVIYWGVFSHIFFNLFCFIYSILIFFAPFEMRNNAVLWYFLLAATFSAIDILVKLNTAYFNKDIIIKKRKLIILKYLKKNFIYDTISLFVIIQKIYENHLRSFTGPKILFIDILGLLKILSLNSQSFRQVIIFRESTKHLLKLIDLILNVVLAAHILSICWYNLHEIELMYGIEMTWMKKYSIDIQPGFNSYIYSLYWAVTTMTTVGYGDITPSNTQEALFTIITMIIMSCVFAYSINNVGMILQEIQKNSTELNNQINTISKFLDKRHVNIELISRVRHYLAFLSEEQKERNKEAEDKILDKLSNKLREEITIEINQKLLNHTPIFTQNFSSKTVRQLLQKMQEIMVAPNEIIFNENQIDDGSMYFIQSGSIQIYHSTNSTIRVVRTLDNMSVFGEISFFTGLSRLASAKSVGLTTLFKVTRKDFLEILSSQEEDFEMFKMIQEKIIFQRDYTSIFLKCYQCHNSNHITKNCTLTHYTSNPGIISLKYNFSLPQKRTQSERRRKNTEFHPLLYVRENNDISQQLKQLHENDNSNMFKLFNNSDLQTNGFDSNSSYEEYNTMVEYLPNSESQIKNTGIFSKISRLTDATKQDQSISIPDENINNNDKITNVFEFKKSYFPQKSQTESKKSSDQNQSNKSIRDEWNNNVQKDNFAAIFEKSDSAIIEMIKQTIGKDSYLMSSKSEMQIQKQIQSYRSIKKKYQSLNSQILRNPSIKPESTQQAHNNNHINNNHTSNNPINNTLISNNLINYNNNNNSNTNTSLNYNSNFNQNINNNNNNNVNINQSDQTRSQNICAFLQFLSINNSMLKEEQDEEDNGDGDDRDGNHAVGEDKAQQYKQEIKELKQKEEQEIMKEKKNVLFDKSIQNQEVSSTLADLLLKSIQKGLIGDKQAFPLEQDMNNFEAMKTFKKFFVHNNLEWVLRSLNKVQRRRKQRQSNYKLSKKMLDIRTEKRIYDAIYTKKKINTEQEITPITCLSYGAFTKKSMYRHPIRYTQKF